MIKKRRGSLDDTGYMDEVYIVTARGERRYLWRAVDQESLLHERSECFGYGDVLDILVQNRKDKKSAEHFSRNG